MRKHFILLIFIASTVLTANAQSGRSIRIGYIDMEYILENVPEYNEANIQLEAKAQKWKQEMEAKKNDISKLKESLKTEQVLLTKELIAERQDEIVYLENELTEYQQKKFGPTGELIVQKAVLVKPIQDQIFTAVQDLADAKKYDFIFDKSSDLTMLFAAKRFDISDYVIRTLARASKRNQMTKKQIKEEEAKEYKENLEDLNPELAEKQKGLDDKKAAREKMLEERKEAFEAKRKEAEARKLKLQEERNAKKAETTTPAPPVNTNTETDKKGPNATESQNVPASPPAANTAKNVPNKAAPTQTTENAAVNKEAAKNSNAKVDPAQTTDKPVEKDIKADKKVTYKTEPGKETGTTVEAKEAAKKAASDAQKKVVEDRKKAIEERKAKVLAERAAAKKAKEEEQKEKTKN